MPCGHARGVVLAAGLLLAALPAGHAAPLPGNDADRAFEAQFGERFLDAYWQLHPEAAIGAGYHRYADRLLPPDVHARRALQKFLADWLDRLKQVDTRALSDSSRTDWVLLRNQLEAERWYLTRFRPWQREPSFYNVAESFALLLTPDAAPTAQRLRVLLARLQQVPAYYRAARRSIRNPTRAHTRLAIQQNQGALEVFGESLERAVAGSTLGPAERALFFRRLAAARQAIRDYVAWLQALEPRLAAETTASFRIGADTYEQKFAHDIQSSYSARQLYERALREKEQLHGRMDRYADELWPRYFAGEPPPPDRLDKIGRLIERLSARHVRREDFVEHVARQIPELERWVTEHRLIELDPGRPLEVRVTPSYQRGVAIASINPPGPYNPGAKTYYNVAPLDDYTPEQAESFLREYNHWILQVLNIHEAVPGHYVQLLYSNRSPSRIKSVFGNGAMIEGWAMYAERLMLESGWGNDEPEMWLMYYKWSLRAVCNTLLDYGAHVLGMPEEQALQLLMHEAFQSENEARGKWRRVQLSSVQLTSYFAGFAEILDLREELKQRLGAEFDLKRFHERFLSYGSAPIGVIRELMAQEPAD